MIRRSPRLTQVVLSGHATPVVTEFLPVDSLGSKSVDLPRFAELAARTSIAGSPSFVMQGDHSEFRLRCDTQVTRP